MAKGVLTFKGFEEYLEKIQKANGNVEQAINTALLAGANEVTNEIKAGFDAHGIPHTNIINPNVTWSGNVASCEVGWELGAYNSQNPSDGYKAMFIEYGTGVRSTKEKNRVYSNGKWATTKNRGKITAKPFFRPALENAKKASSKNKKAQRAAFEKILEELK